MESQLTTIEKPDLNQEKQLYSLANMYVLLGWIFAIGLLLLSIYEIYEIYDTGVLKFIPTKYIVLGVISLLVSLFVLLFVHYFISTFAKVIANISIREENTSNTIGQQAQDSLTAK